MLLLEDPVSFNISDEIYMKIDKEQIMNTLELIEEQYTILVINIGCTKVQPAELGF